MTLLHFIQKPLGQLVASLALTILALAILRPKNAETLWTFTGIIYVCFIIVNSLFVWKAEHQWLYFFYSVGCSVAYLLIVSGLTSAYSSLVNVHGSGESGMIFLVIIYHPFILMFVIFIQWFIIKVF